MTKEFQECAICAAKPGSPYLCNSCLNNRSAISSLIRSLSEEKVKLQSHPDAQNHFLVSMIKSGVRIAGYLLLLGFAGTSWLTITAVGVLVLSEVIGIIEEIV